MFNIVSGNNHYRLYTRSVEVNVSTNEISFGDCTTLWETGIYTAADTTTMIPAKIYGLYK